jgi:hypothetical protein
MRENEPEGHPRPDKEERTGGLAPVKAFFVLVAVGLAAAVAAFATQPDAAPSEPPAPARSPDFSLTDAEAIAEFERLHALQITAYKTRDPSLVPETYTTDSPVADRVLREITELLRRDVTTDGDFTSRRIVVASNTAAEILLRQEVVVNPSFFNHRGQEVSLDAPAELQEIRWTLRWDGDRWLIHDAVITSSRPIRAGDG